MNEWKDSYKRATYIQVGQRFYELKWVYEKDDLATTTKYSSKRIWL